MVWDAVRNVESCGLTVKFLTADGASINRLVFKMCQLPGDKFVRLPNIRCTPSTQNHWSHSFAHGRTRALRVCFHVYACL